MPPDFEDLQHRKTDNFGISLADLTLKLISQDSVNRDDLLLLLLLI